LPQIDELPAGCRAGGSTHFQECDRLIDTPEFRARIAERLAQRSTQRLVHAGRKALRETATSAVALPAFASALTNLLPDALLLASSPIDALDAAHTLGGGAILHPFDGPDGSPLPGSLDSLANPRPELNPLVEKHLRDSGRGAVADELDDALDPLDDFLYQARFAPGVWHLGREWGQYALQFNRLAQGLLPRSRGQGQRDALRNALYDAYYNRTPQTPGMVDALQCHTALKILDIDAHLDAAAAARTTDFGRLVANQPQLVVSYRGVRRVPAVGASLDEIGVTLESGLFNNLLFLEWGDDACRGDEGYAADACTGRYRDYIDRWVTTHELRAALSWRRARLDDIELALPAATLNDGGLPLPLPIPGTESAISDGIERFRIPGSGRETWSAALGFALTPTYGDPQRLRSSRIDLVWEHERYDTPVVRADRSIWRLTYTYRLGDLSVPLNLIYRERSEFRADTVDHLVGGVGVSLAY
ncbi:MAG: hypothetical protein ACLGI7_15820, partial [Gammaproteobacteria bacterium]